MKIIAPPNAVKNGTHTFGAHAYLFNDGVAEADSIPPLVQRYMERVGYEIEGENSEPFDPNKHAVDEVVAYLDSESTSDAEAERVLAAEAEGKARKGVLDWAGSDEDENGGDA